MNDYLIVDNSAIFFDRSILELFVLRKNDITLLKEYDFVSHDYVLRLIYQL